MIDTPHEDNAQAKSFGVAASLYEKARPPYPSEALDWLLPTDTRRVLDLGAGTGKLTRRLRERGLDVIAVEPSEGMRREFSRVLPDVRVLSGVAEKIPLQDDSVDVVLVAQAWHWVDVTRTIPEVARVLSSGGSLGLLWNIRDEREDWVAQLGRVLRAIPGSADTDTDSRVGPPFDPIEHFTVEWRHRITRESLLDLVASRSYVITLSEQARDAVLAEVRELVKTHPTLKGADVIELPYVTKCSRARLTS